MKMVVTERIDGIWRWIFRAALVVVPLVLIWGRSIWIVAAVFLLVPLGMERALPRGGVAERPFSFCLPGFRESLRRHYFGAAALMGLGLSTFPLALALFVHFRYPSVAEPDPVSVGLSMVAAFLAGMVIGLILGTPRLILPRLAWNILMLLSIPLFLIAVFAFSAFVEYPAIGIPVCVAICVFVWNRLGDRACVKRGHRMVIEDATEQRYEAGTKKGTAWWLHVAEAATVPRWADSLFQRRLQSRPYLSVGRYIWGSLYQAFGVWFSYWESIVFGVVTAALVLGLFGNEVAPFIAVICFAFADRMIRLPVASTLLLPGGRREKC